jgi:hypothetical protein
MLKKTSAGVLYSRVFLGRLFNIVIASSISSFVTEDRSPHFGNYCPISPFVFSFVSVKNRVPGWELSFRRLPAVAGNCICWLRLEQ